jgi:predicted dehydrogenase
MFRYACLDIGIGGGIRQRGNGDATRKASCACTDLIQGKGSDGRCHCGNLFSIKALQGAPLQTGLIQHARTIGNKPSGCQSGCTGRVLVDPAFDGDYSFLTLTVCMATMPLRIGLIGAGRHGSRYIHHLLHDLPGMSLAALCRKRIGEGLPFLSTTEIPVYGDYRALIADPMVEAVVVVTPPSLCAEICLEAVKARKPILIEKPLAPTGREARTMVNAAEEAGVLLMTAQTMRFDSTILLLKDHLPDIGRLRYATFTSRIETKASAQVRSPIPGQRGALLEFGVHLLDLVLFLTGEEVVTVRCEMDQLPTVAPDTMAIVQVQTVSGMRCVLDIARVVAGRVARTEWVGTQGQIAADWCHQRVNSVIGDTAPLEWVVQPQQTILATLRAFVRAVETNTTPPITGRDGCRAVEVADACYRSAELGGATVSVSSLR